VIHINSTHIYSKSYTKSHSTKDSRRRKRPWTTLGGLLPPSSDILGALALHRLFLGILLRLLSGLLPPLSGLLLLPFSVDISSKYLVVLPSLLKFFFS
jgi:hypothetical protein